jgi:hypothetical protein
MLTALFLTASLVLQFEPTWYELGSALVSASQDHDTIIATTSQGTTVRAVKITVQRSDLRITRIFLRFEKGEPLELRLHELIPDGGESRTIHLKGDDRAIRSLDFWYDPKTVGHRGVLVELIGREGKP